MKESTYKLLDMLLKYAALLGASFAFIFGTYQYKLDNEREFKKAFLIEQLETCKEIVSLVSEVSQVRDNKQRGAYVSRMWSLYFGRAALSLNDETLGTWALISSRLQIHAEMI